MLCPRCNSENDLGEKFCKFCGAPLNDTQLIADKKKVKEAKIFNKDKKKSKRQKKSKKDVELDNGYVIKEKNFHRNLSSSMFSLIKSIIVLIIIIIALFFVVKYIAIVYISSASNYSISGDKIPSINYVVGDRDIEDIEYKYKEGTIYKTYYFAKSDSLSSDLTKYVSYLMQYNSFNILTNFNPSTEDGTTILYAASSSTYNEFDIVEISWESSTYSIKMYSANQAVLDNLKTS